MCKMCGFNRFYRNMCNPFWTVRNPFRSFSLSTQCVWRFLKLAWAFMQLSTGYFRSYFVKICDFIPEMPFNSASVLIRFSKFFSRICLITWICMLIGLLPTPIPSFQCRFRAEISKFWAEMRSDSHPFYPVQFGIRPVLMHLKCKNSTMYAYIRGLLAILCPKVP